MTEFSNVLALADSIKQAGFNNFKTAVILGSGLDNVSIGTPELQVPYSDIPNFPTGSKIQGHNCVLEQVGSVLLLHGRPHLYQGFSATEIVRPIRALATLGLKKLIITNAAGGVNPEYHAGDIVLISDHINFSGMNPLIGSNIDELGTRFPDMCNVYDRELNHEIMFNERLFRQRIFEGVYAGFVGPSYETPAEVQMLRTIGVDVVGMSTVIEAIAAVHASISVFALSVVANSALMRGDKIDHSTVEMLVSKSAPLVQDIIKIALKELL